MSMKNRFAFYNYLHTYKPSKTIFQIFIIIILIFSQINPNYSLAEDNFYGCSCSTKKAGNKGSCDPGQVCAKHLGESSSHYCYANPKIGYPLNSCGEGCICKSDNDCSKISFAGRCINNHCYIMAQGISVKPLECREPPRRLQTSSVR